MSLHRPGKFASAIVAIAAALTLGAVSCTSDGGAPSAGTAGPTPSTAATVRARPSETPSPRPTATGTTTPTTNAGEFGAAAADPATGDITVLFRSSDTQRSPSDGTPILTPGGDAIWLPTTPDESTRFAFDGTPTNTFPGGAVIESRDGRSLAGFIGEATEQQRTLLTVRDDARVEENSGIDSWGRAFSPDGRRLAWIEFTPGIATGQVIVLEIPGGLRQTLVDGLGRCNCDAQSSLSWSPSGTYLAYEDPATRSTNIVHIETRERRIIPRARMADDPWVTLDGAEWLLTIGLDDNAVVLTPAAAKAEDEPRLLARPSGTTTARIQESLVLVRTVANREHHALIFDPVSGEQLRDLRGEGDVVLTSDGIATAIITRTELACTGLVVEHPVLRRTLPCDVQAVLWSPDARYLALFPTSEVAPIRILDTQTGAQVSVEAPHTDASVTWSGDGTHLLFTWGIH